MNLAALCRFVPFRHIGCGLSRSGTLVGAVLAVAACGAPFTPVLGCSAADSGQKSAPVCLDGVHLPEEDCSSLKQMLLPLELPPSPGNAVADNESAARFGFEVFFSTRMSNGGVRCATCHSPEAAFTDRLPVSKGLGMGTRNSPTTFTAPRMRWVFWDGRADSLWSQPLFALENKLEMDFTRLEIAHLLANEDCAQSPICLKGMYEQAFGALPVISEASGFPLRGAPGDAAFDGMPADHQFTVNQIAANVGKALEAYMRKAATGRADFDRFLLGDATALGEIPKRGIEVFFQQGCADCHNGPMLSDQGFHDVNMGPADDAGRADALAILAKSPFTLDGPFADGGPHYAPQPPPWSLEDAAEMAHKFRTPTLRNVDGTWPYGHAGTYASVREAIQAHSSPLPEEDLRALVSFLNSLRGSSTAPWDDWPRAQ